jgi:hypothetical protein
MKTSNVILKTHFVKQLIMAAVFIVLAYLALLLASPKTLGASFIDNLSVSPYGAMKSVNITDGHVFGAGIAVDYKVNTPVSVGIRATSFETDEWRGSAIDEGSFVVTAVLLKSDNNGLTLAAVGAVDRDFDNQDWGFSTGARVAAKLHKQVELFGESRIRAWFDQDKDLITSAGVKFSF